jgi:hypothetical protein
MLNKKQRQIFTIDDWKQADRIERIYINLVQREFELSYEDEEYLEKLKKVWAILGKTMTKMKQIELIQEFAMVTTRTAFKYIDDAQALFGEILKTDAEIELAALKERYYLLADKAEQLQDYDTARRCIESAQAIIEKIQALNPKKQRVFATVIFTDDPKALTATHDGDEIDFEEIGSQSLLEQQAIAVPTGSAAD